MVRVYNATHLFRALTFFAGNNILEHAEPSTRGACSFCKHRKAKCDFVLEANACRACIAKGLEADCAAPWASSRIRSTSCGHHDPPTEELQSLPENLDSHEPARPDSPSSIRRGRSLTRVSQSDVKPVKSKKRSRSKSNHSDLLPSGKCVVKRILEDNTTHRKMGLGPGDFQMVDERLPTVTEDDEETESVGFSEQITYFGQVMGAREAHKKAKDLFSNLPDSDRDSMSSDHDFNDSSSDGGFI
jgi:hypothetical protein